MLDIEVHCVCVWCTERVCETVHTAQELFFIHILFPFLDFASSSGTPSLHLRMSVNVHDKFLREILQTCYCWYDCGQA